MKSLASVASLGAFGVVAVSGNQFASIVGKCNVFLPGWTSNCRQVVTPEDVTTCGTRDFPCITKGGLCDQCFEVVYQRDDISNGACAGGVCPAYERKVFLKAGDASLDFTETAMSQAAWAKICPHACKTTEICVESEEHCETGVYDSKQIIDFNGDLRDYAGSCDVRELPISVRMIDCDEEPSEPSEPVELPGANLPPQIDPVNNTRSTGCSVFQAPHTSSCGRFITPIEYSLVQPPCGESIENPCMAIGPHTECGKCYSAMYTQGGEGGYTGQAYVKIMDMTTLDRVEIGLSQGAWSKICPHICQGSSRCVGQESDCEHVIPDTLMGELIFPGSCAVESLDVRFEEIEC